ncbi:MAG: RNA polymerase sigma factor, partial [Vicinamibacterales bacterium]
LYRYALMILAERQAAEDAIQQVFAGLLGGRRGPIDDPERYLRRAVRNACYSALRQRRARRVVAVDERVLEALPDAAPAVGEELRLTLDLAIRELPPEQREVLHLHAFEGRTFRDIAEATGDPLNTVASRYRYALEKLRLTVTNRDP